MRLDPQLLELRRSLGRFRRRVWLRRIVRDGTLILAAVVVAELALAIVARLMPFQWHALSSVAVIAAGAVALLIDAVRVRPTLAQAALAVDSEDALADRVSTALSLATTSPDLASDQPTADEGTDSEPATYARLVRLQRRDALAYLHSADPRGLRIPLPRRQSATTFVAALLLVPALLLPNGQNDILNLREQQRAAAENQAQRLDETATRLNEGRTAPDPRVDIAQELRRLAQQLRDNPENLQANLARLGSLEDALRSRIDPANEQRAAAITSLSRALSRSSTGNDSNPQGDPQKTGEDLADLANRIGQMTDEEREALARDLSQQ